jgi:O-antigen/teichoic acid export membrane protein
MGAIAWVGVNAVLLASGSTDILPYVNIGFASVFVSARLVGVRQFLEIAWRMKGRGYYAAAMTLSEGVLAVTMAIVLVQIDALTVTSVSIIWSVGGIPGFLMLVLPLRRTLLETFRGYRLRWSYIRRVSWGALPVATMVILGQTTGQLEVLVIDALGSMAEVGRFSIGITPLVGVMFIPAAIAAGLAPLYARLHRRPGTGASLDEVVSITLRIVGILGIALCAASVLSADLLMLLFPQSGPHSAQILRGYSGVIAAVFLVVLLDGILLALGRRRTVLLGAAVGLAVALTLEILMIRPWGVAGILVAKGISVVVLIAFQLYALHRTGVRGATRAVVRLLPAAMLFASTWWLGSGHGPVAEIVLPILASAAGLAMTRVLNAEEVRTLRALRLW